MTEERRNISVPNGTRDILFGEAELYDRLGRTLSSVFERAGCRRIMTPAIEFYDVFDSSGDSIPQESMFTLTDRSGRLLVLRADNTTPAARVAATRLRSALDGDSPQKLYYCQSVYRAGSGYTGRRSELFQSGVEMIGAGGVRGDLCCLTAALDALAALGPEFKLEIGHVGFFNSLASELGASPEDVRRIREYVDSKNAVSLRLLSSEAKSRLAYDKIRRLPLLYGGCEVFDEAAELAGGNKGACEALSYVRRLYDELVAAGWQDQILVDLGMVHKIDYYTGVLFTGYIDGAGEAVLRGGRYDNLVANFGMDVPAIGFAVNLSAVADTLSRSGEDEDERHPDCVIHYDDGGFAEAEKLRRQYIAEGKACEYSCFDNASAACEYARSAGAGELIIIKNGRAEVTEL